MDTSRHLATYLQRFVLVTNSHGIHESLSLSIYGDFKKFLWLPQKEAARIFKAAPAFDMRYLIIEPKNIYHTWMDFPLKKKKSLLKSDSFST